MMEKYAKILVDGTLSERRSESSWRFGTEHLFGIVLTSTLTFSMESLSWIWPSGFMLDSIQLHHDDRV